MGGLVPAGPIPAGPIPADPCVNVSVPVAEARPSVREPMSEVDDTKPPDNVIPFAKAIQGTIAEDLRKMYAELVREKLPDDISALMKRFEDLSKKGSEPET